MIRLGVNIDHVATLRNSREELYPSVVEAGLVAETHGADSITVHLREDRRHIKDDDVVLLSQVLKTKLNLEMSATSEMVEFALEVRPDFVCLIPETRNELTTTGGINIIQNLNDLTEIVDLLQKNGILVSLFVDPDTDQISAARETNAYAIEINTDKYAVAKNDLQINDEFYRIKDMCELADSLDLVVNAGHGLTYHNVKPIAKIPQINELNIGYAIIAQSIFWGLPRAVSEMKQIILK